MSITLLTAICILLIRLIAGVYLPRFHLNKSSRRKSIIIKEPAFLFDHQYIEAKAFYVKRFGIIPCVTYASEINVTNAFAYLQQKHKEDITDIFQVCFLNREQNRQEFSKTLIILKKKILIELAGEYVEILFPNNQSEVVDQLLKTLATHKKTEKQQDFEINIITFCAGSLELKKLPLKPNILDIELYYNDDFKAVDTLIKSRLTCNGEKGIVLLHGLPGTGKTTYLRHLVGCINKKVLFVSPSVAGNLVNPEFIDLLIDNPNALLIIEDAENIMMDRKLNSSSSVSNLLNLSDGLLSDCLNVQIICTFNSHLSQIDQALMRKGRLIARYEFGKLKPEKAQRLSDYLGFDRKIDGPMTIAEITNPDSLATNQKAQPVIGFRRHAEQEWI